MRPFSLALVAFVAASVGLQGAARAQDANNNDYNWNGFYGGGNLGGAFGGSDFLSAVGSGVPFYEGQVYFDPVSGAPIAGSGVPAVINAYSSNDDNISTFTGGVQLGYNLLANGLLFGIEGDVNFMRAKAKKRTEADGLPFGRFPATHYTFDSDLEANFIASIRPRVGIPFAGGLLYATGGVAVTKLHYKHDFTSTGGAFGGLSEHASESEVKFGWTAGAGFELPIAANTSIRAEYLFTHFGDVETNDNKINGSTPILPEFVGACGADTGQAAALGGAAGALPTPKQCFSHKADALLHSIRLGVNFKF